MPYTHTNLASGGWYKLSLCQQMGNIGSEISRARKWQDKNHDYFINASYRALELLDLSIADSRWITGVKEITRVREIFCDVIFGDSQYGTTLDDLNTYFNQFALAARSGV